MPRDPRSILPVLAIWLLAVAVGSAFAELAADPPRQTTSDVFAGSPASAPPVPFSVLDVWIEGRLVLPGAELDRWDAFSVGALGVGTPFYLGEVSVSASVTQYSGIRSWTTSFTAYDFVLDWTVGRALGPVEARVGPLAGLQHVTLDNDDLPEVQQAESELLLGAVARLNLQLSSHWSIQTRASWRRIYTDTPTSHVAIGLGAAYRTDTPAWLQEVLR